MLGDDGVLALEHVGPVDLRRGDVVDAEFGTMLEVVPDFGAEKEGFGGDAADVEAGAAELVCALDEGGLEPELAGADGGCVACGPAADDGYVVNDLWHWGSFRAREDKFDGSPDNTSV